ncbi:uncharacterized protein LOC129632145 isoform X8 [Bubalus kerabau]|nr:uncharacterized protein LOC129632145 isoform X8 [Bubalus carabanensis]XP_055409573.1 uncharacterized protein LOC129632145 isoform X8 [Bubalus carabanensis]
MLEKYGNLASLGLVVSKPDLVTCANEGAQAYKENEDSGRVPSHLKWKQNTENHAEDPAEDTEGAHIFGSFSLKLCPPGVTGNDDHLKGTQEEDAANGHISANSWNGKSKCASKAASVTGIPFK